MLYFLLMCAAASYAQIVNRAAMNAYSEIKNLAATNKIPLSYAPKNLQAEMRGMYSTPKPVTPGKPVVMHPMQANLSMVPATETKAPTIQLKPTFAQAAGGLVAMFSQPLKLNIPIGNASVFVSKRGIGMRFYILRPFK